MKEAFYFPHYTNSRNDRKIRRLRKALGVEGYGIFFLLLEVLREQPQLRYPVVDIDLLADEFNTSVEKVTAVVGSYDLFKVDEEQQFFSPKLGIYMEKYFEKREKRRQAGIASGKARRQQALPIPATHDEHMFEQTATSVKQGEEKRGEERKGEEKRGEHTNARERDIFLHENESLNVNYTPPKPDPEIVELSTTVIALFGFSEMRNPDKLKIAFHALTAIKASGKLDYLKEQFAGFAKKYPTGDRFQCGLDAFLGTSTQMYLDGKWNSKVYAVKKKVLTAKDF